MYSSDSRPLLEQHLSKNNSRNDRDDLCKLNFNHSSGFDELAQCDSDGNSANLFAYNMDTNQQQCTEHFIDLSCPYSSLDSPIPLTNKSNKNSIGFFNIKSRLTSSKWSEGLIQSFSSARARMNTMTSLISRTASNTPNPLISNDSGHWCCCPIRSCLGWKWFWPLFVCALSLGSLLLGTSCFISSPVWFKSCSTVMISSSFAFPVLCFSLALWYYKPTRYKLEQYDFYSEALLEEMLSRENILDVYTVFTQNGVNAHDMKKVVVFLSAVGGVRETWHPQVRTVVDMGFTAISIQLPGSGTLGAVRFSLPRAERVVKKVLEIEIFLQERNLDVSSRAPKNSYSSYIEDHSKGQCGRENLEKNGNTVSSTVESQCQVVLVTWGTACHVAMYLAASQRLGEHLLDGVVFFGSPRLPGARLSLYESFCSLAFRVPWIMEARRFVEFAGLSSHVKRLIDRESLQPEAHADWAQSFDRLNHSLNISCSEYKGPLLCVSGSTSYLKKIKESFGNHFIQTSDRNLQVMHVKGLPPAGFRSYPPSCYNEVYSRLLLEFLNSIIL